MLEKKVAIFAKLAKPKAAVITLVISSLIFIGCIYFAAERHVGDLHAGAPELRPDARYNQDINEITTPVEANLGWTIGKRRRKEGGFPGFEIIIRQLKDGVSIRRYGIRPDGRAPARAGTEIFDLEGKKIGDISSGGFGPTVGAPIAMAYIDSHSIEIGSKVSVLVRDNLLPATIVALPFITPNYKRT